MNIAHWLGDWCSAAPYPRALPSVPARKISRTAAREADSSIPTPSASACHYFGVDTTSYFRNQCCTLPIFLLALPSHNVAITPIRMRQVFKTLGLLLLLMAAQQGAVVHELSHFSDANHGGLRVQADAAAEKACALCPAFAQVVTPAFSHSFHIPLLVRFALESVSRAPICGGRRRSSSPPQPRTSFPKLKFCLAK